MSKVRLAVIVLPAIFLLGGVGVQAQECERLRNSTSDQLISYLNRVIVSPGNGDCVTYAVDRLGKARYQPAIPILAKFLDFRRPLNAREKQGIYLHIQVVDEIYPAASALEEIGNAVLPAVLDVIRSESSPKTSRENAVYVWMEIYKYESPKGIKLLKEQADEANDATIRQNLVWSVSKAVTLCNPPDQAQCEAAAR